MTLLVLGPQGVSILSDPAHRTDGSIAVGRDYSDRNYFQEVRRTEKTVISEAIISRLLGRVTLQIVVPIKDSKGKMIASVSGGIDFSEIESIAGESIKDDPGARMLVLDENRRLITQAGGATLEKLSVWGTPAIEKSLGDSGSVVLDEKDESGQKYYGALVRVPQGDRFLYVVFSRPYSAIMASAINVLFEVGVFIFFAMIISMIISYLVAARLAAPVFELSKQVRDLGSGSSGEKKQTPGSIAFRYYELTMLSISFQRMKRRLNRQTLDLENRVEMRTKDLIHLNQELETQRARNQYADKMASLGEMAAGIAHEINNPLAVIAGRTFLMKKLSKAGAVKNSDFEEAADMIEKTVMRIAKIIQALRFFSRDGAQDEMVPVEATRLFEETIELCRQRFVESKTELRIQPIPKHLPVFCRGPQISQVILNLLNNAFDAVQNNPEKWVSLEVFDDKNELKILVTDSGKGIPAELQEKIMQPFFTTKPIGKGTGLGLSVSRGIIASHGGSLEINPESPNTQFVLRLPKPQPRPETRTG